METSGRSRYPVQVSPTAVPAPAGALPDTARSREEQVEELACPLRPETSFGISRWYRGFRQVSDETVKGILAEGRRQQRT